MTIVTGKDPYIVRLGVLAPKDGVVSQQTLALGPAFVLPVASAAVLDFLPETQHTRTPAWLCGYHKEKQTGRFSVPRAHWEDAGQTSITGVSILRLPDLPCTNKGGHAGEPTFWQVNWYGRPVSHWSLIYLGKHSQLCMEESGVPGHSL